MIHVYDEIANWYRTKRHLTLEVPSTTGNQTVVAICSRQVRGLSEAQFEHRRLTRGTGAVPTKKPWRLIPYCLTCLGLASKNQDLAREARAKAQALIQNRGVPNS